MKTPLSVNGVTMSRRVSSGSRLRALAEVLHGGKRERDASTDTWMLLFFGASVYDKPEVYERSSPIAFIKKTKTPTLVLHGDRDSEVPTPQGYEFWHALKALGVPTDLVIYTEEGHAISKPEHQRDIEERLVAWFDKYLAR